MVAVPFIEKKDLQIIFCNVEQLERLSSEMADELERARDGQAVAAVFMRNIPRANDYMEYCANYDRAIERIDHLKASKPEYTKFIRVRIVLLCRMMSFIDLLFSLRWQQCVNREKGTQELANYLIRPIQHPPRWRILLEVRARAVASRAFFSPQAFLIFCFFLFLSFFLLFSPFLSCF